MKEWHFAGESFTNLASMPIQIKLQNGSGKDVWYGPLQERKVWCSECNSNLISYIPCV